MTMSTNILFKNGKCKLDIRTSMSEYPITFNILPWNVDITSLFITSIMEFEKLEAVSVFSILVHLVSNDIDWPYFLKKNEIKEKNSWSSTWTLVVNANVVM